MRLWMIRALEKRPQRNCESPWRCLAWASRSCARNCAGPFLRLRKRRSRGKTLALAVASPGSGRWRCGRQTARFSMNETRLHTSLRAICQDLFDSGASYAVVGGLAVSARTEPRFTRDLDLAVSVADDRRAESLVGFLRARHPRSRLQPRQGSAGRAGQSDAPAQKHNAIGEHERSEILRSHIWLCHRRVRLNVCPDCVKNHSEPEDD